MNLYIIIYNIINKCINKYKNENVKQTKIFKLYQKYN